MTIQAVRYHGFGPVPTRPECTSVPSLHRSAPIPARSRLRPFASRRTSTRDACPRCRVRPVPCATPASGYGRFRAGPRANRRPGWTRLGKVAAGSPRWFGGQGGDRAPWPLRLCWWPSGGGLRRRCSPSRRCLRCVRIASRPAGLSLRWNPSRRTGWCPKAVSKDASPRDRRPPRRRLVRFERLVPPVFAPNAEMSPSPSPRRRPLLPRPPCPSGALALSSDSHHVPLPCLPVAAPAVSAAVGGRMCRRAVVRGRCGCRTEV